MTVITGQEALILKMTMLKIRTAINKLLFPRKGPPSSLKKHTGNKKRHLNEDTLERDILIIIIITVGN